MGNTPDSRPVQETGGGADLLAASVCADPSYTLVRLTGEWDVTVCDQLRGMLAEQVRAGARKLVVDLWDVAFLDLACLYALLEGARMISLLGADRLFAVRTSVADATAG